MPWKGVYLGDAGRAVPVPLRDTGNLGFVTVSVAAFVAAIAQQEKVLVVSLLAHLTVLWKEHPLDTSTRSLCTRR